MINNEIDIKDKFAELCSMIFINSEGKFIFPVDNLIYDGDWSDFLNHKDWIILDSKMSNLINLLNQDHSILEKDVQDEIWDMV